MSKKTQNEIELDALDDIMDTAMQRDIYPEKSAMLLRAIIKKAQATLPKKKHVKKTR